MTRNQRTDTMGHEDLNPLTEHILAQLGDKGADIRKRLKNFYRRRSPGKPLFLLKLPDKTG